MLFIQIYLTEWLLLCISTLSVQHQVNSGALFVEELKLRQINNFECCLHQFQSKLILYASLHNLHCLMVVAAQHTRLITLALNI